MIEKWYRSSVYNKSFEESVNIRLDKYLTIHPSLVYLVLRTRTLIV